MFPDKKNYKYIGFDCTNKEANITWNNETWRAVVDTDKPTVCTLKFEYNPSVDLYDNVNLSDYIVYEPIKKSYDISNSLTGMDEYSESDVNALSIKNAGKQTINPSELNLWRVIRKNSDKTIDMVSEDVSSVDVSFYGKTGYKQYIKTLNIIAKQYETEGITSSSRYMGYNGQIETLDVVGSPRINTTNNDNEAVGGGDVKYLFDVELINSSIGNLCVPSSREYLIAGRFYCFNCNVTDSYNARIVSDCSVTTRTLYNGYNDDKFLVKLAIRPIVTLKPELNAVGEDYNGNKKWFLK